MSTVFPPLLQILSSLPEIKPGPPWSLFSSPLFRSFVGDVRKMGRTGKLCPVASWEGELWQWAALTWLMVPTPSNDIRLAGIHVKPWG